MIVTTSSKYYDNVDYPRSEFVTQGFPIAMPGVIDEQLQTNPSNTLVTACDYTTHKKRVDIRDRPGRAEDMSMTIEKS